MYDVRLEYPLTTEYVYVIKGEQYYTLHTRVTKISINVPTRVKQAIVHMFGSGQLSWSNRLYSIIPAEK